MKQVNSFSADNAQTDGRLRQAQLKMLDMLQHIDAVCQRHQLDYWLEGGTLLGAIRHQGFIPWDDDLDISMPRDSFLRFMEVAPQELPKYMWLQTAKTDKGYFNLSAPLKVRDLKSRFIEVHEQGNEPYQQGIFIDVFVYDKMDADTRKRKRDKWLAKKIQRLLSHKYSRLAMGHHANIYQILSRLFSQKNLEKKLQDIIHQANSSESPYWGYGYDCVNRNLLHYEDIYPLKRCRFETAEFNIAQRSERILTQLFGDYMELPPVHQRVMKHCRELIPELDTEEY